VHVETTAVTITCRIYGRADLRLIDMVEYMVETCRYPFVATQNAQEKNKFSYLVEK